MRRCKVEHVLIAGGLGRSDTGAALHRVVGLVLTPLALLVMSHVARGSIVKRGWSTGSSIDHS